jgi:hypothetical protein
MKRRRCHDKSDGNHGENDRGVMQLLLGERQFTRETVIEYRDQLKSEQCLNARQHHKAFFENVRQRRIQRKPLLFCWIIHGVSSPSGTFIAEPLADHFHLSEKVAILFFLLAFIAQPKDGGGMNSDKESADRLVFEKFSSFLSNADNSL